MRKHDNIEHRILNNFGKAINDELHTPKALSIDQQWIETAKIICGANEDTKSLICQVILFASFEDDDQIYNKTYKLFYQRLILNPFNSLKRRTICWQRMAILQKVIDLIDMAEDTGLQTAISQFPNLTTENLQSIIWKLYEKYSKIIFAAEKKAYNDYTMENNIPFI